MRHYKQISDNYIVAIGTGHGGIEITEAEYTEIMSIIQNCPQTAGKGYHLKTDLTWEEYDLPPAQSLLTMMNSLPKKLFLFYQEARNDKRKSQIASATN